MRNKNSFQNGIALGLLFLLSLGYFLVLRAALG